MFKNSNLLLVLFALLLTAPGCKKKGAEDSDVISADAGEEEAGKKKSKKKGKKKSKKKSKKKKSKKEKKSKKDKATEKVEGKKTALEDGAAPSATGDTGEREKGARKDKVSPRERPAPADRKGRPDRGTLTPPPVKIAVARLLTVTDLNKYLMDKGWIAYGPIQGIPPSDTYNSLIYRKPGTNRFVSLLVWDFPEYAQALARWNELFATYPNAQELKDVFTKFIFFSYRNQVTSLTFLEPGKGMVLSLSCHSQVCDDASLYALAQSVFKRAK